MNKKRSCAAQVFAWDSLISGTPSCDGIPEIFIETPQIQQFAHFHLFPIDFDALTYERFVRLHLVKVRYSPACEIRLALAVCIGKGEITGISTLKSLKETFFKVVKAVIRSFREI
ncbi:MAG TPA: hypothetical protein PLN25_04195 [Deltaproteobacteria bacterium]|nr:hypothetical protein [Deltaproteobacteria bacterium]HQB38662.1 hypothetical protein [Deltaproteobacteria bacterium]